MRHQRVRFKTWRYGSIDVGVNICEIVGIPVGSDRFACVIPLRDSEIAKLAKDFLQKLEQERGPLRIPAERKQDELSRRRDGRKKRTTRKSTPGGSCG